MAVTEYPPSYPVTVRIDPVTEPRNKMTVAFRIILAIPHILLVGGLAYVGFTFGFYNEFGGAFSTGVLGAVAGVCAIICWFAILFANQHPKGLKDLCLFYLRWRTRAVAYMALFRDDYPPFGDEEYPAGIEVTVAEGERNKTSIALRIIYAIPHLIILWGAGHRLDRHQYHRLVRHPHKRHLPRRPLQIRRWRFQVVAPGRGLHAPARR